MFVFGIEENLPNGFYAVGVAVEYDFDIFIVKFFEFFITLVEIVDSAAYIVERAYIARFVYLFLDFIEFTIPPVPD